MPKAKKSAKRRPKKESEVVYIRPTHRGNIDPRLIRKAVIAVWKERLQKEAEARANSKPEANGETPVAEDE